MIEIVFAFFGLLLLGGMAAVAVALRRSQMAAVARGRLFDTAIQIEKDANPASDVSVDDDADSFVATRRSPVLRRYWWLGFPVALMVALALWQFLPIPWPYLLAFSLMILLCVAQVDVILLQNRIQKLEQQLADSIDMMVAAVKSGAGLQAALESSVSEMKGAWPREAQQLVRAIRYGEDPVDALGDLSERLPLESVMLFSQTLAVNWRVGGRLALTLANVGRTVRDRIELSRRMNAMTTQARLSVISVVATTYFIAALIWRNDPERMTGFLTSMIGQILVCAGMVLQIVGTLWINWMSKPKF